MGLTNRVTITRESVLDFSLPDEKCDILLAEGLLNVIGFKKGLPLLLKQVKPDGYMIIHDEYKYDSQKRKLFHQYQLNLMGSFELDEKTWREDYYTCLEQKIRETGKTRLYAKELTRINSYKSDPRNSRSVYYILQK